jgi:CO dehydrogenase maturation factor
VDCTAGADSFASGMFTRFDLTILVAEPTRKSLGVWRQWRQYAAGQHVALVVAGNKVQTPDDAAFLCQHAGEDLLTWFGHEPAVRALEQGRPLDLADLSPSTHRALTVLQDSADAQAKDWARFTRQAVELHLKNARAWANAATGTDLTGQVDPDFVLSP